MARTINGKTTTLALIGDPVGHSLSPQMHNYACELLGLNYVYVAYTVKEEGVPAAFDAMRALGIRGFNVTMPCKIAAFENVDKRSEAAEIMGACNTVINDGGVLTGHITDGEGYVNMLRDKGIEVAGKKVIVCGAGGAGPGPGTGLSRRLKRSEKSVPAARSRSVTSRIRPCSPKRSRMAIFWQTVQVWV